MDSNLSIIVRGLGGQECKDAINSILKITKEHSKKVISFYTMPFKVENRMDRALKEEKEFLNYSEILISINNQTIQSSNLSLQDFFDMPMKIFSEIIKKIFEDNNFDKDNICKIIKKYLNEEKIENKINVIEEKIYV